MCSLAQTRADSLTEDTVAFTTAPRSDADRAETARNLAVISALLNNPRGMRDLALALRGLATTLETVAQAPPANPYGPACAVGASGPARPPGW
jgi:hypothetical protein